MNPEYDYLFKLLVRRASVVGARALGGARTTRGAAAFGRDLANDRLFSRSCARVGDRGGGGRPGVAVKTHRVVVNDPRGGGG